MRKVQTHNARSKPTNTIMKRFLYKLGVAIFEKTYSVFDFLVFGFLINAPIWIVWKMLMFTVAIFISIVMQLKLGIPRVKVISKDHVLVD
jgi:hypothetical protein